MAIARTHNSSLAIAMLMMLSITGPFAAAQVMTPSGQPVTEQVGIAPKLGKPLPLDLEFVDSFGKVTRLADCFTGKPVILHLVYYECPMLCKLSSDGLFKTLNTLSLKPGEDFSIVTLSFDPRETPAISAGARRFAIERCGPQAVGKGWHFLTGNQPEIDAITSAVGFRYMFDDSTKQYAHAAGIFVLTPSGIVSRYLSGINYTPRDVRLALVEASSGKVGTATDQMLLLCYMYNPVTGKYGLAIISAIRAAGVATVGMMGVAIFVMLRREKREHQSVPATPSAISHSTRQ
jgi:protein SCO1